MYNMATFLGLGTSVLFGNTVRASTEVLTDFIAPLEPNDTVTVGGNLVVDGSISNEAIRLTGTETNIGVNAGQSTNGSDNTFVGANAGNGITTGTSNTIIGAGAGDDITTGSLNTIIGENAGTGNATGVSNIYIGRSAGATATGSNCIYIGRNAGFGNILSDLLIIDNTGTAQPLIHGNFNNKSLQFNGDVQLGTLGGDDVVDFQTTVDGAAGASAGFITVKVNGINRKIEFFAV